MTLAERKKLRETPWSLESERQAMESGMCGSRARHGGTCTNAKGYKTTHVGFGRCKFHGGSTKNGTKAAEEERIQTDIGRLIAAERIETDDPVAGLAEAQRRAQTMARVLDRMVSELEELWVKNHHGDEEPHVAFSLLDVWNEKSARISKLALDARLDERREARVEALNQAQGELLAQFLRLLLADILAALVSAGASESVVRQVWTNDVPGLFKRALGQASGEAA